MTVLFWDRVNANASCSSARLTISGAPPTGVAAGTSGDAFGVFADLRDRGGGVGGHHAGVVHHRDHAEAHGDGARGVGAAGAVDAGEDVALGAFLEELV